jgi:hypothetical protein
MSKLSIPFVAAGRDANGNRKGKKSLSHGSKRCQRHPNSKRCTNGSMS